VRQAENLYFLPKISPVKQTILPDPLPLLYAGEEGPGLQRVAVCGVKEEQERVAAGFSLCRAATLWVFPCL
jgi:hypothetical protein